MLNLESILDIKDLSIASGTSYVISDLRQEFPLLEANSELAYLDSAATTQKPRSVLNAIQDFYVYKNANIHRGVYQLSQEATSAYDESRHRVGRFLNAASADEVIFVRGATEGINLIAQTWGKRTLRAGDEIVVSGMEHHANIVPWQLLAEEKGLKIKVLPVNDKGELCLDEIDSLFTEKVKLLCVTHVSNTLGTINPLKEIIGSARARGIVSVVDGAQAISHLKVDVTDLDCDFYVFSGHKVYGPTGIGVVFGRQSLLNELPPYQGGGDMISSVTFEKSTFKAPPERFEAGTPNISGAVGLGAALEFMENVGIEEIQRHEKQLSKLLREQLSQLRGLRFVGEADAIVGVASFVLDYAHPHDVGTVLDSCNVAVRTGHHCTQPLMKRFGVPATTRASLGIYNNEEDIDRLILGMKKVERILA